MAKLFSKRHTPPPDQYRYDLPEEVRWRILHTIEQLRDDLGGLFDVDRMLQEVGDRILREYGEVLRVCSRVYSLKLGRLAFDGMSEELKNDRAKLKKLFL